MSGRYVCWAKHLHVTLDCVLTNPLGEMQEGEGRVERRSEYIGEGDYDSPRFQPELTAEAAGHRSRQR